jgi:hypothetical protein
MQFLRADTEVIVTIGPFVDVTDGFTPQTDITLGGNEAEIIKHGATAVVDISSNTFAAVTACRGYYSLTLTTTDTNTEGMLVVIVQDDSDTLPVKQEYMVLAQAAWISMFVTKASGFMDVDAAGPAISDIESSLVIIKADIVTIDDFLDTEMASQTSNLVIIASDTLAIEVDTSTTLDNAISDIKSELVVISDAVLVIDDLLDTEIASLTSNLVIIASDTLAIEVDTGTTLDNAISDIESSLVIVKADLVTIDNFLDTEMVSQTSNLVIIASDTLAIEVDTTNLNDTAISELAATTLPAAEPNLRNAVMLMYMALRNKLDVQTSGVDAIEIHDDAGAQVATKAITDSSGDYSEAKMIAGV